MVKRMEKDGYIPFEIQEEIMKRLPVKSLIRFRCVSKPWKSLIHSSKFMVDYRVGQPQLLVWSGLADKKFVLIADDDTFPRHKLYMTPPTVLKFMGNVKIGISSHGLLCYHNYFRNLVLLWNPAIRKTVSIDVTVPGLFDSPYSTQYGFGVCPSTCDPKLVKTIFNTRLREICSVEVFSLSSGVWRSPHSNLPRKSIYFPQCHQVYVDGCIYWSASDYVPLPDRLFQRSKLILSFSVTNEEFTEIGCPNSLALKDDICIGLSKLRESLLVLEMNFPDEVCGVWMMMNHDNPKSFTKLFNINMKEVSLSHVVGFANSGEAIVLKFEDANNALFVYEPNSKHVRSLTGILQFNCMNKYTETLLLLDH